MSKATKFYDVFLNGELIDSVCFTGYTIDEAKASLVNNDGYDPAIVVEDGSITSEEVGDIPDSDIVDQLTYYAQNNEMIDSRLTISGDLMVRAAAEITRLRSLL